MYKSEQALCFCVFVEHNFSTDPQRYRWGARSKCSNFSTKRLFSSQIFCNLVLISIFPPGRGRLGQLLHVKLFKLPPFNYFGGVSKNTPILFLNHHQDWSLMTNDCCIVLAFTARSVIWKSSGHPSKFLAPTSCRLFVNCVTHPISSTSLFIGSDAQVFLKYGRANLSKVQTHWSKIILRTIFMWCLTDVSFFSLKELYSSELWMF